MGKFENIRRKQIEKQKVLEWTREMKKRVYYMYAIYNKQEYWKQSKFCVDYLINLLEDKTQDITKEKNQKVLDWLNDKIYYTATIDCVENKEYIECITSLKYLKNLLLKLKVKEAELIENIENKEG